MRLEIMGEHAPVLQRRILVDLGIEMIHQAALARQEELPVGRLDHDLSGILPLEKFLAAADERFIGRLRDRTPLALACSLDLGHRGFLLYDLKASAYSPERAR